MGGSSRQTQTSTSNQTSSTRPWEEGMPLVNSMIGQLNGISTGPSAGQTNAAQGLVDATGRIPDFSGQATTLANDLFSGGNNYGGMLSNAYGDLTRRLSPIADGSNLNPMDDPGFKGLLDTMSNDISDRINAQFAAAGRDMSPGNDRYLARGISEGIAPVVAQQYNTNVNRMMDAANSLYTAGGTTAQGMTALDDNALNRRTQGMGVANDIAGMLTTPASMRLQAENTLAGLPLDSLSRYAGVALPLAQLGSESSGTSNSTTETTRREDPTRAIIGAAIGGLGLLGGNPMGLLGSLSGGMSGIQGMLGMSQTGPTYGGYSTGSMGGVQYPVFR